jgi:hypothetical protein
VFGYPAPAGRDVRPPPFYIHEGRPPFDILLSSEKPPFFSRVIPSGSSTRYIRPQFGHFQDKAGSSMGSPWLPHFGHSVNIVMKDPFLCRSCIGFFVRIVCHIVGIHKNILGRLWVCRSIRTPDRGILD